jgi:UDPglucose--hexose-1-phosphate uridylyltransferase
MFDSPHRRLNPLTGEWVLVSPHRASRPWLGQVEKPSSETLPPYDTTCYLCPGNDRAGGQRNPNYDGTFVFDNDFSSLLSEAFPAEEITAPLFSASPESGICRVICFSPRHDLTLPELTIPQIEDVIVTWIRETQDLATQTEINYVQVFENKGAMMGCSNPHPHSQVWAQSRIPNEPYKEFQTQCAYFNENQQPMLINYLGEEHRRKERIVEANDHFTALVPFWAIWPFELLLVAHRSEVSCLTDLNSAEISSLAGLIKHMTARYDNLFEISFPYSMGFHQAPSDGLPHPEWILHAHFYPPLLRSASVRKFMVGYEMLAMPQRDITPEVAALTLRGLSDIHYHHRG